MTIKEKQKKQIKELHDKYYKDKKKEPKETLTHSHLTKKLSEGPIAPPPRTDFLSRNELMDQARAQGVKNFRVLNKAELAEVIAPGVAQARIDEVVAGAVSRWKSGWGTKSREAGKDHKE